MARVHVGEVGTPIRIEWKQSDTTTAYDLTGNTLLQIILVKPSGTQVVKTAVLVGAATLGVMQYVVESGVLDVAGTWQYRGHFEIGTPVTDKKLTDFYELEVGA